MRVSAYLQFAEALAVPNGSGDYETEPRRQRKERSRNSTHGAMLTRNAASGIGVKFWDRRHPPRGIARLRPHRVSAFGPYRRCRRSKGSRRTLPLHGRRTRCLGDARKLGEHVARALLGRGKLFPHGAALSSAVPMAAASSSGWKLAASCAAARLTMREPRRCSLRSIACGGSFRSHTIPTRESTFKM
jgi:hypothetical protein